ncbi:unnamed protein product, partial [Brenthis ino]
MAIKVFIFLLGLTAISAKPVLKQENRSEIEILLSKGLIGFVPVVIPLEEITSIPDGPEHNIQKRSALRGDNPNNDLLADFEGANYENSLTGLDRRIKTLPSWVG